MTVKCARCGYNIYNDNERLKYSKVLRRIGVKFAKGVLCPHCIIDFEDFMESFV